MARRRRLRHRHAPPSHRVLYGALCQVGIDPATVTEARWEPPTAGPAVHPWDGGSWLVATDSGRWRIEHDAGDPILDGALPWTRIAVRSDETPVSGRGPRTVRRS